MSFYGEIDYTDWLIILQSRGKSLTEKELHDLYLLKMAKYYAKFTITSIRKDKKTNSWTISGV